MSAWRAWGMASVFALAAASCTGRPRSSAPAPGEQAAGDPSPQGPGEVAVLDLASGVPESTDAGGFFPLPAARTYAGLLRSIERASRDGSTTGFFVRLGGQAELGLSRSEEIGRVLEQLRKNGKPVVCHAHTLTNATAWLAARGCDRVWVSPVGDVEAVGIAAQLVYFKRAFEKYHVKADFLQTGKYKGADEPFTREGPSAEARESLMTALRSLRQTWLDGVAQARKAPAVRESMEAGPFTASEAKTRGLIDEIGFEDEAREDARKRANAGKIEVAFGPSSQTDGRLSLAEIIRTLSGADERTGGRPRIAVVPAEGAITMASGEMLFGGGITEKALSKTLRRLGREEAVKAVVLRVDSPGGSALASDILWHEVTELRKKKPVVASVGEMAASGGYYISCAANRVVAETTSIVGSIGVVSGKFVIDGTLDEIGIDTVTLPASPAPGAAERAAYQSPLKAWDDRTRQRMLEQANSIYERFIARCAEGRGVPAEKIRASAEGRIWSGAQGKERGLIDDLGGLERALGIARELGKLDADAPVVVEGGADSLLELLLVGDDADESQVSAAVKRFDSRRFAPFERLPRNLRPFFASVSPLLDGEHAVLALPFAALVK